MSERSGDDACADPSAPKVPLTLTGVPETLLWNLYHRSIAAADPDNPFEDPKAIELVARIDYPFEEFVTEHTDYLARWHALRVQTLDAEIRRFLTANPGGTVVALGEGLETQFWRVDDGQVRWLSVDVPEAIDARAKLLPEGPRQVSVDCSAMHERWMDEADTDHGLLITAQGLLMYLPLTEVEALVSRCARRFPGESFVFDSVPARMVHSRERLGGTGKGAGYQPPPWVWGMQASVRRRLSVLPGVSELREVPQVKGHGLVFGMLLPTLRRVPWLAELMPTFPVLRTQFASRT
ncbi:class I SAM-dependent methyltransferase [Pseudonocardia spinosispora]|uniref:class I SAM-dependent methyltransferase n=1 Tax=Pseudonocardia spinosispora TaxID=103441 RepID=UPI000683D9DE|nr:class I SAM-dependent methyltransferase [Pseudonocardia spinosispora]